MLYKTTLNLIHVLGNLISCFGIGVESVIEVALAAYHIQKVFLCPNLIDTPLNKTNFIHSPEPSFRDDTTVAFERSIREKEKRKVYVFLFFS